MRPVAAGAGADERGLGSGDGDGDGDGGEVGFSCGVGLVRLWGVGGMGDVGRGLMMFYYPWLWNRFVVGIAAGVVLQLV